MEPPFETDAEGQDARDLTAVTFGSLRPSQSSPQETSWGTDGWEQLRVLHVEGWKAVVQPDWPRKPQIQNLECLHWGFESETPSKEDLAA